MKNSVVKGSVKVLSPRLSTTENNSYPVEGEREVVKISRLETVSTAPPHLRTTLSNSNIPWVEKYRPSSFEDIILSSSVRKILSNIIPLAHKDVPNLLFFGPPGTGKTTTIMRWISLYHTHHREHGRDLILHLNASDERGLDTVRERIEKFATSGNLFSVGMKFVIMDEFDAMTPSAQYAFKEVVTSVKHDVRFVVICNYIHRIERTIRDEFMNIEFTSIPPAETIAFLQTIIRSEGLAMNDVIIDSIYARFSPDIRSMINYIQSNRHILSTKKEESADETLPLDHNIKSRNDWILGKIGKDMPLTTAIRDFEVAVHRLAIHMNIGVRDIIADLLRDISEKILGLISLHGGSVETNVISYIHQLKTLSHTTISLKSLLPACCMILRNILSSFPSVHSIPHSAPSASP